MTRLATTWVVGLLLALPWTAAVTQEQAFGDWRIVGDGADAGMSPAAVTAAVRDSRPRGETPPRLVVKADYRGIELQVNAAPPPPTRVPYRAVEIRVGSSPGEALTGLLSPDGGRLLLLGELVAPEAREVIQRFVDGLKRSNTLQVRVTDPEDLRQRVLTFSLKGSTGALEAIGY